MSSDLRFAYLTSRVKSANLRVTSLNPQGMSSDLRIKSSNQTYELRVQMHKLQVQKYGLGV